MENSLSYYDYGVVAFYFLFMVGIAVVFRNYITNTSDYFRGGGQMVWWMAGSSAFMVQFSATKCPAVGRTTPLGAPVVPEV